VWEIRECLFGRWWCLCMQETRLFVRQVFCVRWQKIPARSWCLLLTSRPDWQKLSNRLYSERLTIMLSCFTCKSFIYTVVMVLCHYDTLRLMVEGRRSVASWRSSHNTWLNRTHYIYCCFSTSSMVIPTGSSGDCIVYCDNHSVSPFELMTGNLRGWPSLPWSYWGIWQTLMYTEY